MADKKDKGYEAIKEIVTSPKGAAVFAVSAYAANTVINKAKGKALVKSVKNFIDNTADSIAKALPDAK